MPYIPFSSTFEWRSEYVRIGCRMSTVFTKHIPNTDEGFHCASYQRGVAETCSIRSFVGMGNGVSEVWVGYTGVLGWEECYIREINGSTVSVGVNMLRLG
jgi:hypothetical protein